MGTCWMGSGRDFETKWDLNFSKVVDWLGCSVGNEFDTLGSSFAGAHKTGKPKKCSKRWSHKCHTSESLRGGADAFSEVPSTRRVKHYIYCCTIVKCLRIGTHNWPWRIDLSAVSTSQRARYSRSVRRCENSTMGTLFFKESHRSWKNYTGALQAE